ncbi:MAG: hypothetical protein ACOYNI_06780 [Acidimicrobiia bacterium]
MGRSPDSSPDGPQRVVAEHSPIIDAVVVDDAPIEDASHTEVHPRTNAPDDAPREDPAREANLRAAAAARAANVSQNGPSEAAIEAARAMRRRREFRMLMQQTYPSVADTIMALTESEPLDHTDDWLGIARLLSDERSHRTGGLSAEARERAIHAAAMRAVESQARSSARIAGYHDVELDDPWEVDPEWSGQRVWEHYLCADSILLRESLHGEMLGEWLGAIGELWIAADNLLHEVEDRRALLRRPATPVADPEPYAFAMAVPPVPDATPSVDATTDDVVVVDARVRPVATAAAMATIKARPSMTEGYDETDVVDEPDPANSTDTHVASEAAPSEADEAEDDGTPKPPKLDELTVALHRMRAALETVKEAAFW